MLEGVEMQRLPTATSMPRTPPRALGAGSRASLPDVTTLEQPPPVVAATNNEQSSRMATVRRALASPRVRGLVLASVAGGTSGAMSPWLGTVTHYAGPLAITTFLQCGIAALVWSAGWCVPQAGTSLLPLKAKTVGFLAGEAAFGAVIAPATLSLAYQHTSAASVSLAMNLQPVLSAGGAWLVFKQQPSKHMAVAGVATVASGVLCAVGQLRQSPASGTGIGLAVASAAAFAACDLFFGALSGRKPQYVFGLGALVGSAVAPALAGALRESFPHGRKAGEVFAAGVVTGVVPLLITLAMRDLGVGRARFLSSVISLTLGVLASSAAGKGKITPLIGASLGVALLGAAILGHEAFAPPARPQENVEAQTQTSNEADVVVNSEEADVQGGSEEADVTVGREEPSVAADAVGHAPRATIQ